jgi:hypothetical protein
VHRCEGENTDGQKFKTYDFRVIFFFFFGHADFSEVVSANLWKSQIKRKISMVKKAIIASLGRKKF